ncbi:MAG: carbohydrate ABC transporter permease [Oscillospiraceae bacterium]|nr:carbohydrate ABC transporter permease [Oscillospiraceae bacterium]
MSNKRLVSPEARRARLMHHLQTVAAILVTLVMLFPLYWMLITSLKTEAEVLTVTPTFWPKQLQWSNYVHAWNSIDFLRFMFNTLYVTLWNMLIQTVVGVLAAYGFARGSFPGKNLLFLLVLSALMIPAQVTFIPIYVMIANLGWVDTFAGLILPGAVSAYMIYMLRNNFMSVDQSYLDAGRVDGLGILGTIWYVLIPMCRASVITTSLVSFINGWNNYFWPKILSKSDETRLISVALVKMKNMWEGLSGTGFYNTLMAGVAISIIPVVLIFAFNQKYMLKGYSKSAMK